MKKFLFTLLLFEALGCCQDSPGLPAAPPPKPDPVLKVGAGVSAPALLYKVQPAYTEEARQAGIEGTVVLYVEINPEGRAVNPKVIRSLGHGLDEKALQAVAEWKFRPGAKDGTPVTSPRQLR